MRQLLENVRRSAKSKQILSQEPSAKRGGARLQVEITGIRMVVSAAGMVASSSYAIIVLHPITSLASRSPRPRRVDGHALITSASSVKGKPLLLACCSVVKCALALIARIAWHCSIRMAFRQLAHHHAAPSWATTIPPAFATWCAPWPAPPMRSRRRLVL